MSRYLVDANVLLRFLATSDVRHETATNAITILTSQGHTLCITPQNMIEFWNVASRPLQNNGFGWDLARCALAVSLLLQSFAFLPDTPSIFDEWQRLVNTYNVSGVQVHDTRLVAVAKAHALSGVLTFNEKHFRRFETHENIIVIEPTTVR